MADAVKAYLRLILIKRLGHSGEWVVGHFYSLHGVAGGVLSAREARTAISGHSTAAMLASNSKSNKCLFFTVSVIFVRLFF